MGNSHIFNLYEVTKIEQATEQINAIIEECGARLVAVEKRGGKQHPRLEFLVDTETGITSGELATITKRIVTFLDETFPDEDQTILVSSPGLDRPLVFPWQYRRHAGHQVELTIGSEPDRVILHGVIANATDDVLTIDRKGVTQEIPFTTITHAVMRISLK